MLNTHQHCQTTNDGPQATDHRPHEAREEAEAGRWDVYNPLRKLIVRK